tara:strand:+ start:2669 stop:2875 length:207 start_codon:yes stop_codon:yes gene_type:complete
MATIDDLHDQAVVTARSQTKHTPSGEVEEVTLRVIIPRTLLDTISGGDTRSRVMVRDWLKVAADATQG